MVFKLFGLIRVMLVGIVANNDVRAGNDIFDAHDLLNAFVGIYIVWVGTYVLHIWFGAKSSSQFTVPASRQRKLVIAQRVARSATKLLAGLQAWTVYSWD